MPRDYVLISGGQVHDPTHGIDGEVRDIWIAGSKIVPPPDDVASASITRIDARGLVVLPGGIDMHCHIAGPKVNRARRCLPEINRSGEIASPTDAACKHGAIVPTSFLTGCQYLALGYTAAFDAAIPPSFARTAHLELADIPGIDKGFYVVVGNHHYVLDAIGRGREDELRAFLGWLLNATRAYGLKLVNPGGVERWKQGLAGTVAGLDEPVASFAVTPRSILRHLAQAADSLRLPHSVHIHANNLGLAGNWQVTLDTMRALEGHRGHLAHIQFHSYGGDADDEESFCSRVEPLVDYVNQHPNVTVDVGQILFGTTIGMTSDTPVSHFLSRVQGTKWIAADSELEGGCGIVPITYRQRSRIHSWQWAIGLEWFLLARDPWRIALTTDHPNGASFRTYPKIIKLLMDRDFRAAELTRVHPAVRERSALSQLDREYSLSEIVIITRAGPARMLGLSHKGHLAPGADADVAIYAPLPDKEAMFASPRYVFRAGRLAVDQGEPREVDFGRTHYAGPEYDRDYDPQIQGWFEQFGTIRSRQLVIADAEFPGRGENACQTPRRS